MPQRFAVYVALYGMNIVSDLFEVLDSCGMREDFEGASVWRIEGTTPGIRQWKAAVLDGIFSGGGAYVRYEEAPDGIEGAVQLKPQLWSLPAGTSGKAVLDWLYMGNWQLSVGACPPDSSPDLCRSEGSDVAAYVRDTALDLVIDSFHDDVSWVVGLARNAA
jgi:hypothetical protein